MTPEAECRVIDPTFRVEHENHGAGVCIVCRMRVAGGSATLQRVVPLAKAEAARAELVADCLRVLQQGGPGE